MALYDTIIVDSSSIFWRTKKDSKNNIDILKRMISYIDDAIAHLKPTGTLYILFDMISDSDLGLEKTFTYNNWRNEILPDYKMDRVRSPLFKGCLSFFKRYYSFRGEQIKLLFSEDMEADDYVQPLINIEKEKTIALVTTDYDWSGFISDKCHVINDCWDKPMTKEDFINKFEFKPTYDTVILYKAMFGDVSDNIKGAIYSKRSKFNVPIKRYILEYLQEMGQLDIKIDDVIKLVNIHKIDYTNRSDSKFEKWFTFFKRLDLKCSIIDHLLSNIKCIRSQLEGSDIDKYIHWQKEQPETNKILYQTIFGQKFSSQFGKI